MSGALPAGALPAAAVVCVVGCAFAIARERMRRLAIRDALDERLAGEVHREILSGRIPEARDRLRRASGPLARVLLAVFRFPYGVHREAVELGWAEAIAAERKAHPVRGRPLPVLAALAVVVGVVGDLSAGLRGPVVGTATALGVLGGAVVLGLWGRWLRVSRRASRRLEDESAGIAGEIVALAESPDLAGPAGVAEPGAAMLEHAAASGGSRPQG